MSCKRCWKRLRCHKRAQQEFVEGIAKLQADVDAVPL